MAVKKIGEKRYRVMYEVLRQPGEPRKRRSIVLENTTRKAADAFEAQKKADLVTAREAQAIGQRPRDSITLGAVFEAFLEAKQASKEATTVQRYESLIRNYLARFSDLRPNQLSATHLIEAYGEFGKQGYCGKSISVTTLHHVHSTLKTVLRWAFRRGLVSRDVADLALAVSDDLPKRNNPKPLALTPDELRAVLEEAKNPSPPRKGGRRPYHAWLFAAIVTSAFTGARRGEVLALRWSDIDFENKGLTIARSVTQWRTFKKPKSDKARWLPLRDSLSAVIQEHRTRRTGKRRPLDQPMRTKDSCSQVLTDLR